MNSELGSQNCEINSRNYILTNRASTHLWVSLTQCLDGDLSRERRRQVDAHQIHIRMQQHVIDPVSVEGHVHVARELLRLLLRATPQRLHREALVLQQRDDDPGRQTRAEHTHPGQHDGWPLMLTHLRRVTRRVQVRTRAGCIHELRPLRLGLLLPVLNLLWIRVINNYSLKRESWYGFLIIIIIIHLHTRVCASLNAPLAEYTRDDLILHSQMDLYPLRYPCDAQHSRRVHSVSSKRSIRARHDPVVMQKKSK